MVGQDTAATSITATSASRQARSSTVDGDAAGTITATRSSVRTRTATATRASTVPVRQRGSPARTSKVVTSNGPASNVAPGRSASTVTG